MRTISIIIEIDRDMLIGVYTNASLEQDFEVVVMDHDETSPDEVEEIKLYDELLSRPGWRGID